MDIVQLAKDFTEFMRDIEPGIDAARKAGEYIYVGGQSVVKILQQGKQLVTYWIRRVRPSDAEVEEPAITTSIGRRDLAPAAADANLVTKGDVAVLVDINRRMLMDVSNYLVANSIDADLIVVTNDESYSSRTRFLSPDQPDEWEQLVQEFCVAASAIKLAVGAARLHIFLSTPLPLAFALGSVWGTVDEALVYHWENNTYHPVMKISRRLRQQP